MFSAVHTNDIINSNVVCGNGSEDTPYKLTTIGGGPSGCSVIVRAIRTGNIDKLCQSDELQRLAGVCLIDQCSLDRFGGGRLQDYEINSNTFANKFSSNVIQDKTDTLPPESCTGSYVCIVSTWLRNYKYFYKCM